MKRFLWTFVAVVTVLRLVAGFGLPLTGDEAYYWEWSRRLAAGYVDHPPAVAWTAALFGGFGAQAGVLRLSFWLCGVIAVAAAADAAYRLTKQRAGEAGLAAAVAAALLALAPIGVVALGTVSPDGPFLASWAVAIDASVILAERPSALRAVLCGLALGASLLSRAFGTALLGGAVVALRARPAQAAIAMCVALLCTLPFIAWNAGHGWVTFVFTLFGRHVDEGFTLLRPLVTIAELILALGPLTVAACIWVSIIAIRRSVPQLVIWTSWPLCAVLFALSLFERVEVYWFLGPAISLIIGSAVVSAQSPPLLKRPVPIALAGGSVLLITLLLTVVLMPFTLYRTLHLRLHNSGPFEIYTTAKLAQDVRALAATRSAIVMTDGYGFSSLLDYNAGIPPVLIGYSWQGREARPWYVAAPVGSNALFVDKQPLADRPDFARQLTLACRHVESGPVLTYPLGDIPARAYSTTWCLGLVPHAVQILRWENQP